MANFSPVLLQSCSHIGIFLAHNSVFNLHSSTYLFSNEKQSGGKKYTYTTSCIFILFIVFCEQKYSFSFLSIKHMVMCKGNGLEEVYYIQDFIFL